MMDFNSPVDLEMPQNLTNCRMRNFINRPAGLRLGIDNSEPVFKKRREIATRYVAILVNRRSQNGAPIGTIPAWVVRPAAEEGNTKWRSRNDHDVCSPGARPNKTAPTWAAPTSPHLSGTAIPPPPAPSCGRNHPAVTWQNISTGISNSQNSRMASSGTL
jgi:hypothetical protein